MRRKMVYGISILAVLLLIQFFQPEKNLGKAVTDTDFIQVSQVPDTLASRFLNACYDCHSNHTRYPWYGNVAPFSWYLNHHIIEGKAHLNFSSWGIMDKAQIITALDQICEETENRTMPLKSYLWIHRSAKLSDRDIQAICDWAEARSLEILTVE